MTKKKRPHFTQEMIGAVQKIEKAAAQLVRAVLKDSESWDIRNLFERVSIEHLKQSGWHEFYLLTEKSASWKEGEKE